MIDGPPPGSTADRAYRALRHHLAEYHLQTAGMGEMGVSCRVCGTHAGRAHSLCQDLAALADLEAWVRDDYGESTASKEK